MSATTPTSSLSILLLENHDDSRRYLTLYLEACGHRVISAASMEGALAVAGESDFDVVLSDIGLPDGDGWEFLQKAKFARPVFAVAMSGFGMNADRERSKQGYRHHLLKPIDIEKLDGILAEAAEEGREEPS